MAVGVDNGRTRLNYDSSYGIDSIGLSGGNWLIWDSNRISVDLLPHGQQALHLLVKVYSNPKFAEFSWLLSGVYASTTLENRLLLWEDIKTIPSNFNAPWVLIGDFNEVINTNE